MSSSSNKPSFETLKAADSGRRLVSKSGRYEVVAKILRDAEGEEFLVLRAWVGSHPSLSASAEWSEPSLWQHVVLNDDLDIVATGWGKRERDSFAMVQKALKVKGVDVSGHSTPESATPDKFVWKPGDVDVLTPDQAAEALGFDPEAENPT